MSNLREVKHDRSPLYQPTLLDRVVNWYNPVRGAQRAYARVRLGLISADTSYHAGSKKKRGLAGWITRLIGGSADADTLPELPTIRERSRDLVRNSPLATGAVSGTTLKAVGRGLRVQAKIDAEFLGLSEEEARDWQRRAEFEFNTWAGVRSASKECDASRYQNFAGLQALVFRSALESGDCLALLPRFARGRFPYRTRVQLIEADRVTNEKGQHDKKLDNGNVLAGGIELDSNGAPITYHILRGHPGNRYYNPASRIWDKVPAYGATTGRINVLHLMTRERPGQTRGVPFLAPVIETLKQLDRYTEAEITAAVVSGLFAVFVKSNSEGLSPLESAVDGMTPGSSGDDRETSWDGKLTPGLVADLQEGEEIESVGVNRPNTAFDAFVLSVMRQVGAALNIPFEVLVKHFQSSYSASRAALLEAWTFYRERRAWLAANFCQPIYEAVIEEAVLLGRLPAPGFLQDPFVRTAYCRALWTGDGPGSIDPLREAKAAEARMAISLQTLEDEVQQYDGTDYEDKIRQRARELDMMRDAGVAGDSAAAPDNDEINRRGDTVDD